MTDVVDPTYSWEEFQRIIDGADYRISADIRRKYLLAQQERLRGELKILTPANAVGQHDICQWLAIVHEGLGEYEEVEHLYELLFPSLSLQPHGLVGFCESIQYNSEKHRLVELRQYVHFLAATGRKLEFAEAVVRFLPWVRAKALFEEHENFDILLDTIRVLNHQSNYSEATKQTKILGTLFPGYERMWHPSVTLQVAITQAGQDNQVGAQRSFIHAFILSSVHCGSWHSDTLNILFYFGKALKDFGKHREAIFILEECCLGSVYRLGVTHPVSQRALAALKTCQSSQSVLETLQRFGRTSYPREKRLSIAYTHTHLNTALDLLQGLESEGVLIDYKDLKDTLENMLELSSTKLSANAEIRALRTMARCESKLGDVDRALEILQNLVRQMNSGNENRLSFTLDLATYTFVLDRNVGLRFSKEVFAEIQAHGVTMHQVKAVHKRLASNGLTHFTREILAEHPSLNLDQSSEVLGTGAYAVVDSVKIGKSLYARKSVMLPRYNQRSIRNIIQNEVSVISRLDHPHIIRVHLTYEDKSRFCIVMQPLADYDLEAFLEEHTQKPPTLDQRAMVWRWLLCLSNTLAFIHSKNVRHKDIKPRNILVKGQEVIFADFGSSHAFLDDGNSTTEGPAFGHTKIYCAPEVIANGKRGRSADVFSLGCVFIEFIAWLAGYTIAEWVKAREMVINGTTTIAYSETMARVKELFIFAPQDVSDWISKLEISWLYQELVLHMIQETSQNRCTALKMGEWLLNISAQWGLGLRQCSNCSPEIWVDSSTLAISEGH